LFLAHLAIPIRRTNLIKSVRKTAAQLNLFYFGVWQMLPQDTGARVSICTWLGSLRTRTCSTKPPAVTAKTVPETDLFAVQNVSKKILLLTMQRKLMKYLNFIRNRKGAESHISVLTGKLCTCKGQIQDDRKSNWLLKFLARGNG